MNKVILFVSVVLLTSGCSKPVELTCHDPLIRDQIGTVLNQTFYRGDNNDLTFYHGDTMKVSVKEGGGIECKTEVYTVWDNKKFISNQDFYYEVDRSDQGNLIVSDGLKYDKSNFLLLPVGPDGKTDGRGIEPE